MNRNVIIAGLLFLAAVVFVAPRMRPSAQDNDAARAELRVKLGKLGARITFARYDADGNGKLDRDELTKMLTDAEVGNVFTRGTWVTSIIAAVDTDRDGMISWDELQAALKEKT